MELGQIEVLYIFVVKSIGLVVFKYGMGCFIGYDVIVVFDQFMKFIIDWFQMLCGSYYLVIYGGRIQMDFFMFKDIQLFVQRQVVVIFGGSNVGQYIF